jgi:hypothetical protein
MNTINKTIVVGILFFATHYANAQPFESFELKGKSLGMDIEEACADSPRGSMQKLAIDAGVKDIAFPAEDCNVSMTSIAGIQLSKPVNLLFWKGKLVRIMVNFQINSFSEYGDINVTLNDAYGAPSQHRSKWEFRTAIWKKPNQTLEFQRSTGFPTNAGIYMTSLKEWNEYEATYKKITTALERIQRQSRLNDLKR